MTRKEKAERAWVAITAILAHKKEAAFTAIEAHLRSTPKPHVLAVQFIMVGAGFATSGLVPDGEYGKESEKTLDELYLTKEGH